MAPRAAIFGSAGPTLSPDEAAFFREADPWGFILFARNIETPAQLRRLTAGLREAVGRETPILVDQEGGRVERLTRPHWRTWRPVLDEFDGDEDRALEAVRLRYTIISAELRDVGIDVNCVPLLDVLMPETHKVIGRRALGSDAFSVISRAGAVLEGTTAGGALPVIKHIPGHGRAAVDSHDELPVVSTPLADLQATDFATFRAFADQPLGMTAHVVFEAVDPDACATLSPACIAMIRDEIGFQGLLMTDDLSMKALRGTTAARASGALAAGCDMILHCNGDRVEMAAVAGTAPELSGPALDRARRAEDARTAPADIDIAAAAARYEELTGELVHG